MPRFVFLVNNDGYKKYTYLAAENAGASVPKVNNGLVGKIFEIHNAEPLNRYIELPLKCVWFRKVVDESKLEEKDEIYFILYESFYMSYSRSLIKHYKKKYKRSKFLFFFTNPANEYNLGRLNKIIDLIDGVFSFNKADVDKYGFLFLEAEPFLLPKLKNDNNDKTDVFFIGAEKGRLTILLNIFEKLHREGLICDFWITGVPEEKQKYTDIIHYNQRLTYDEVLKHDANTKCIIEVLQDGKSYSSIRTTEALQYHKKLLTMSGTTKDLWFYRPEIIHVFQSVDEIPVNFIRSKADEKLYEDLNVGSFKAFEEFIVNAMTELEKRELNVDFGKQSLLDLYRGGILKVIKSDLEKLCEPTFLNAVKMYLFPRGTVFRFAVWFRILQWAKINRIRKMTIGPVAYLIQRHYEYKYGIHVNANIYVGEGLHIVHGDGVHLNCEYVGKNFTVFQGTTLGAKHGEKPTILDNVTVYTNSVVCGAITLYDDCIVGAQSYVDKDVDAGAYVAGIPAKVIKSRYYYTTKEE